MSLTRYLCVTHSRAAIEWYREVFQAIVKGRPYVMEDGRIGHVELSIGGSVANGATLDRGPESSDYGRTATFHDPFGHRWMINS